MYAIVVIGYNRNRSMERLLTSLKEANYYGDAVDLIISIDKSDNDKVKCVAEEFVWDFGRKILKVYQEKQGLRKHILACGLYLNTYEAIAVLEDDIIVSPFFYRYMKNTIAFYEKDENIAGISLYGHSWNVIANMPFQPIYGKYDTYFMQFAQSWGQIWLRKPWEDFYNWYCSNETIFSEKCEKPFPESVANWPETSWLKYHIKYCVENNKFFVYPYISLTTNFTESGTHNKKLTRFQVPMLYSDKVNYILADFEAGTKYDAFFENINLAEELEEKYKDICVDIYGYKPITQNRYLLTTKILNYEILDSFALELRPHEMNVSRRIQGMDIYLYDTAAYRKQRTKKSTAIVKRWNYHLQERFLMWNEIIPVAVEKITDLFKNR